MLSSKIRIKYGSSILFPLKRKISETCLYIPEDTKLYFNCSLVKISNRIGLQSLP